MKSTCLIGLLITGLVTGPASAAEPAAQVQSCVTTTGDIWVGQRVVISVKLLTPGFFASAAAFDLPQVDGLVIVPPSGSPIVGSEMIDDQSLTTQTHELSILPQRAGTFTIPSFTIRFDSTAVFGQPTHPERVTTSPLTFTAKMPPGAEGLALILTTPRLMLKESWRPEMTDQPVPAGTAFTRTIQIQAENLPGMLLPSFRLNPPAGIRVYSPVPLVDDQSDRGTLTGRRTETSTIVCERPGDYQLPTMTLSWWNPVDQQLNRVNLPGHSLTVISPPPTETTSEEMRKARTTFSIRTLAFLLAIFSLIGLTGWRVAPLIIRRGKSYGQSLQTSEPACFRDVIQACRSGDAPRTYRALLAWRQRIPEFDRVADTGHEAQLDEKTSLIEEYRRLESAIYGPPAVQTQSWSPARLEAALVAARTDFQHQQRRVTQRITTMLPALNPAGVPDDESINNPSVTTARL